MLRIQIQLYLYPLANPSPRTEEHAAPWPDIAPLVRLGRQPARDTAHHGALRVRHDGEDASVGAAHTRNTLGASVGVVRVRHCWLEGGVVDVPDGREVPLDELLRGHAGAWREGGAALPVGDGDGERGAVHAVQEDGGAGWIGVVDADHADTAFVLFARVALEAGPVRTAWDQFLEAGEELASVADAQGERVGTLEESLELLARVLVQEDRFGPALACAKDVSV